MANCRIRTARSASQAAWEAVAVGDMRRALVIRSMLHWAAMNADDVVAKSSSTEMHKVSNPK
jgi:hypothetical protein